MLCPEMDFSSATMGPIYYPRHERPKQPETLCEVLTKHKVGPLLLPHLSPKPAVLAGGESPAETEKATWRF